MLYPDPAEAHKSRASESSARRHNIRKGTRSCWDCKRRKVRCVFAFPHDTVCNNCRRRGAVCASQELPEELAPPRDQQIGDRIARVEDLVQDLAKQVNALTGTILSAQSQPLRSFHDAPIPSHGTENGKITRALLAAFPSHQDTDNICQYMCRHKFYFHLADSASFGSLEREGLTPLKMPPSSVELMDPASHPVLLAKKMLLFCSFLQSAIDSIHGLAEEPGAIINRLVEAVSTLVTTNEKLHGTMECLECIIYESVFHKTNGNLKKAWQVVRRALLVAQMMGIHRSLSPPVKNIDPSCRTEPHFVWFRILYLDRYLCLLLGLPQGTPHTEMPPDSVLASDGPLDKLGRLQAVIASRIIDRNEKGLQANDLNLTQEIDAELIRVGSTMPEEFWISPRFVGVEVGSEDEFWAMARVSAQMFYFNLVTQLHLPYLLLFDPDPKYDYSRIACMSASRELLTRFLASHHFRSAGACHRALGFIALLASMALLLGHFDSRLHPNVTSVFAHQRRSDRAMIECMLQAADDVRGSEGKLLDEKNEQALRRLLLVEEDFSKGRNYTVRIRSGPTVEDEDANGGAEGKDSKVIGIPIPHFSHITIERRQVASKDQHEDQFDPHFGPIPLMPDFDTDMDQFLVLDSPDFPSEALAATQTQIFGTAPFVPQLPGVNIGGTSLREQDLPEEILGIDSWTS
ncbi:unnamed protein product [Clonostachys chloroleuca]|uniref:Zn(2)-C6 fungal-type domain-containing protein n=1 Tax=Clonostachys chloroleuca TaxID=1926264 RepID=A0AA35M9N7_9HYPO|nr:unnamed protein product [Clonostachys chloroleuca]